MMTKTCSICLIEKDDEHFPKDGDKRRAYCKQCHAQRERERRNRFPERTKEIKRNSYIKNAEKEKESSRIWYYNNKERNSETNKKWREANKEYFKQLNRQWRERNKEHLKEYKREYEKHRRRTDENFQCMEVMRRILWRCLLSNDEEKMGRTCEILGYSPEQLNQKLEFQFKDGMGWHNRHLWHVDHKIQIQKFLDKGETRPHVINALSNLQPLWASENCGKNEKGSRNGD